MNDHQRNPKRTVSYFNSSEEDTGFSFRYTGTFTFSVAKTGRKEGRELIEKIRSILDE